MADLVVKDLALRSATTRSSKASRSACTPGQVVALLGPSGSGKTTLLRAVAGLETPHRGIDRASATQVFFDAARKIDLPAEKRGLGLVFQSYALWPHRTVFDNVAYGLKLRERRRRPRSRRGSRSAGADRARPSRRALSASAFGRPAAARRARPRAGLRAAGDPARRAAVQPRRQAARGSARLAAHADRRRSASRRSSSPTTRSRRWRSPTASRCSMPA